MYVKPDEIKNSFCVIAKANFTYKDFVNNEIIKKNSLINVVTLNIEHKIKIYILDLDTETFEEGFSDALEQNDESYIEIAKRINDTLNNNGYKLISIEKLTEDEFLSECAGNLNF